MSLVLYNKSQRLKVKFRWIKGKNEKKR
jgi:hypothetical protein